MTNLRPKNIYPVAEVFRSIQGEGMWTGTQMTFVRLAGCNVGKRVSSAEFSLIQLGKLGATKEVNTICTSCFGESFVCDTDYRKTEQMTAQEIRDVCEGKHLCLTGGEPFLHDLKAIADLETREFHIHVETSGTLPIPEDFCCFHVCCSPKLGFLTDNVWAIEEYKFLVSSDFQESWLNNFIDEHDITDPIYLQPINDVNTINKESLKKTMAILERHPNWRLSVQLHKILEVR